MKDNFREFLMIEYASRVAKSESMDFTKGYYKNQWKKLFMPNCLTLKTFKMFH